MKEKYKKVEKLIWQNRFDEAKEIILHDQSIVHYKDESGHTLLHAVPQKQLEFLKFLISKGADVNASFSTEDEICTTPLMFAAQSEDYEAVEELLNAGAEINYFNDQGHTAFMASIGNIKIMDYLYEKGANINFSKSGENSALWWAVAKPSSDALNWLFDKGIDKQFYDLKLKDALEYSIERYDEVVKELNTSKLGEERLEKEKSELYKCMQILTIHKIDYLNINREIKLE
ncbi:MAG: ankyrin repeat domain-containing protein, partial [Alphaproteobacteria bacterium]